MAAQKSIPTLKINIQDLCDRILDTRELTRQEQMQLMSHCLNNKLVTKEERRQINQVLDEIQFARLRFVT
ncbi:MAG: hypothetical protein WBB82_13140 [Limnothrix sp.]